MALNSINTNASALSALSNLSNTQTALQQTQNIISTGKKINTAKDNGAVLIFLPVEMMFCVEFNAICVFDRLRQARQSNAFG